MCKPYSIQQGILLKLSSLSANQNTPDCFLLSFHIKYRYGELSNFFYSYFREIELKKVNFVLLSIDTKWLSYFRYILY